MKLSKEKKQLALNIIEDAYSETTSNEERACIITSKIEALLQGRVTKTDLPFKRLLVSDKENVLNLVRETFKETTSHGERVCILGHALDKADITTITRLKNIKTVEEQYEQYKQDRAEQRAVIEEHEETKGLSLAWKDCCTITNGNKLYAMFKLNGKWVINFTGIMGADELQNVEIVTDRLSFK